MKISARHLTSFLDKSLGLMGKDTPEPVYFTTRWGIHTFFMRFPIDVIILNEENKVMETIQNLMPNRIFMWNPKYKKVIELPMGSIAKQKIQKGEVIKVVPIKEQNKS